jgi:glycosyltransferase involved in cell wall biosynthesis
MWLGLSQASGTVIVWCPPRYVAPPLGLRHLVNVASTTKAICRLMFPIQSSVCHPEIAGTRGRRQVATALRGLLVRRLESQVFAIQRHLFESLLPYRRTLMLGIPLAVARRLLGIPVRRVAAYEWRSTAPRAGRLWIEGTKTKRRWWRDSVKLVRRAHEQPDPRNRAAVAAGPACPLITVIITAYNEGLEVRRTVESVRANTESDHEIIIVDDGSTDGCCCGFETDNVRVIRHPARIGVAYSRDEASLMAQGSVLAYLDGHQRVNRRCLDRCARTAVEKGAIVWPDVRHMKLLAATAHGASMRLCPKRGYVTACWRPYAPRTRLSRISALRAPGYVIPREIYERVHWVRGLRGWGASELAIGLKAFFLDIDILHLCGPLVWHRFRKGSHYEVGWNEIWRNHALIMRVCFDDHTWFNYWLPQVFQRHTNREILQDIESDDIMAQHEAFLAAKRRPDRDFWRGLFHVREPSGVTSTP